MKNIISSEMCEACAECCKKFPFIRILKTEINALEQMSGLHFEVFAYPVGNAVEDYFVHFQENGSCIFLNEKRGMFSCGVYEARPGVCRNYPSETRQNEVCNADRVKFMKSKCRV